MVEPVVESLEIGKRNFWLNGFQGHFVHALVGDAHSIESQPPTITVDGLAKKEGLTKIEILHADIQGYEYAMLLGARGLLGSKLVRFGFISTHGFKVHAKCLGLLRKYGYKIIAEHTTGESYSVDGLIVASADSSVDKVDVTKNLNGLRSERNL
jgi:Methyltransferase FkbM domain